MAGLEEPQTVDLVATINDWVVLIMVEDRSWGADARQPEQLMLKIGGYFDFVQSGQLVDTFPDLAGLPVIFELKCVEEPSAEILTVLRQASVALAPHSLLICHRVFS